MDDYCAKIGPDGSLVVPPEAMAAAGLPPGAAVVVRTQTGKVAVEADSARTATAEATREFWAEIERISRSVPPEEWAKLPADLSQNLDHYLYGSPKRR